MSVLRVLLPFLFCFIGFGSFAQSYSFLNYSIAEGLPQSQVTSISEDHKGYLWVGTLGGLARFNGKEFKNFSTEDGLLSNRIFSLDFHNEKLWIGHEGGISMYQNRKIKHWEFNEEFKKISVTKIIPFKGEIIIATNGGGIYKLSESKKITHIPLGSDDQNRVRGLVEVNGTLYIATRGGLIQTQNLKEFHRINSLKDFNISGITSKNNEIYISTFDEGIFSYNLTTKKISILENKFKNYNPRNCILDTENKLWSVSRDGIIIVDKNKKTRIINESNGLPINAVSCVFEDLNGTIWIGLEGKGLLRFPGEKFVYFNSKNGIQSDLVISCTEFPNDNYWFGTFDKGLISHQKGKFTKLNFQYNIVWALEHDYLDNIWFTGEYGLFKLDINNKIHEYTDFEFKTTTLFKDEKDIIWFGGANGLGKILDGKPYQIPQNYQFKEIGTIRNITKYNGQLICASDNGLFSFNNGKYTRLLNIKKTVFSLKTDLFNNLWIGTEEGLFWSNGKELRQINLSNQSASNYINFINCSANEVFVGTNNGLYLLTQIDQKDKVSISHFGLEDGLVSLELNINSSFIDSKGRLWFGSPEGLIMYNSKTDLSESTKKRSGTPFLNVKSLQLNFQKFNYSDYSKELNEKGLPLSLVLPYTKNNLTIDLDGVLLKKTSELKFEYWLEGLDEDWLPEFSNPQITLSNLPSGTYILHVRSKNGTGEFSKEYQLKITIKPIFYKTWWFITLISLLFLFLIFIVFKIRLNREREKSYKENLEFKSRLLSLEQQSLNASMNRHFIFNSLNSIQYFINTQDKVSANKYLTNFAKLIRKNLDSSSEKNNMVSLSQEIERLELYMTLESMRFSNRFEYKINIDPKIDPDSIQVPAMLFQPFIENSIIHGILPDEFKKGIIKIDILKKDSYLEVILEDNGIGIEFSISKKTDTVGDHFSQGMEITSKRIELLKKLSNKNFELHGPFQIEDDNRLIKGTRVLIKIPLENLED
jgi:ligand-binding sensor domain-containing protein